jgi:uncharacterized protein
MDHERLSALLREIAELPDFALAPSPSVDMRSPNGNTPLHIAALRGDAAAVHLLIEAGADPNAIGERGCTPLHQALEKAHRNVARILVAAGGSMDARNRDGITPRDMTRTVPLWEGEN